jgi:ribulose-5-phosphate 4-epimerase/fuculose-1-phosphate aldolase
MLRNHGLLTVGSSVADAFVAMYFFETACMIQVRAAGGRREAAGDRPRDRRWGGARPGRR